MGSAPPPFSWGVKGRGRGVARGAVVGQNVRDTNHAKIDMTRLTCSDLLGLGLGRSLGRSLGLRRWCY